MAGEKCFPCLSSSSDEESSGSSTSHEETENDRDLIKVLCDLIVEGQINAVINYMERNKMTPGYYYKRTANKKRSAPNIDGSYVPLPVGEAAFAGKKDIMNAIIARGFDPNAQDDHRTDFQERRPIHYAIEEGHLDIVKCLIEDHGVNVDSKDGFKETPLVCAVRFDNLAIVKYLVEAGAKINYVHEEEEFPLSDEEEFTEPPLHAAAGRNVPCITEYLISKGASVNAEFLYHGTALSYTCNESASDCVENVRVLINGGSDVHYKDLLGRTPFLIAALNRNPSLMRLLHSSGADPYVCDGYIDTPLHIVFEFGFDWKRSEYESLVYLVVELGISYLNVQNSRGKTPFALAIEKSSNIKTFEHLVHYGCHFEEEISLLEESKNKMPLTKIPGGRKYLQHLKQLASCVPRPRALQELAVFKLRRLLGVRLESALKKLPLPEILKDCVRIKWYPES